MSKPILLLFLWIIYTDQISAECMHSGELYLNGSTWNPDICSSCTCQDPIAVCNRKRCSLTACDPRHGKRLIIPTGSCCPVCVDMRNSCHKDGKIYENDAVWDVSSCMTCHCKWGRVDCSSRKCPTVHCLSEETLEQLPGQCCPKCVKTRNSCLHGDRYHPDGSSWNPIPCTKCFCQNGRVKCSPIQCPSLICPTGQTELSEGECCPKCTVFTCKYEGHTFQEGETWQRAPCEDCSCIAGEVFCIRNQCNNNLACPRGQIPWTFPGECCPVCANPSGQCDQIHPARLNKEIWPRGKCEFCQCYRGNVNCQKALCPRISCQKPFVEVHKENACCAECILPQDCEFNDRKYKSGEVWHPDSCSLCSCNNGDVSCYQQTCIVCPPNTYHVPTESSCCGYCQPYECTPECAECIPDQPSVCTKCADPDQFVHNGKCKDKCPDGYYGSSENLCKKCHENCLSCSKGGLHYCTACKSGLLYLEGQCVSQCPEGYHLQNWRCQACHRSCRTCIGPEMRQCLSCSLPGQLLFKGRCVDHCPPAMYVENKHCIACSQGCLKCSASSKKCLVCADDAILHNGYCSLSCPDGFYAAPDGIHCIACHPGCLKCDGGGEDNCLSCHGGAQLREGKCHLPCTTGYYRTYEGHCKSCHAGCELCHLDPNSRKSNCIRCKNERKRPSGSKCVSPCGESQYLQNGFCRDCSANCLRCTNEWTCQECQLPLVLSDGKCVTHCAPAEYVHVGKGRICNGCSPGCSKCSDTFNCFACFDGLFLKNNFECVEDCGPDHYSNPEKRLCEENSFAPEIRVVDQLLINGTEETGSLLDIVEVLDADTSGEDLIIYLVKPPENGNIVRIDHGKDVTLAAEDTFTLKELKNNRVIYVPGEERMAKDVFVLKASDRQLFSEEVPVHAVALPDGEIELVKSKSLTAIAGDVTPFSSKNVDFISEVPPEDVTLTVLAGPFHGNLATSQGEVKVLTLEQLQQGGISYRHDGSNAVEDSFVLQAYDGYNVLNTIVDIHIRSKGSKKPILMNNKIGYVKKGKMVQISSELLKTVSADKKNAKNGDIVYTLVPSHNNPQYGDLIMVVPALHDEHEEDEGWKMMDKNQMSKPLVRFLQRDIDEGRIWYKHKGGEETLDKFYFEVADTSVPPNVLGHQEFQISVSGSTEHVSKSEDGSHKISVPSNEYPLLVTEQIFVKEDHSVTLTNSSLSIIGVDHKPLEVIFKVDQPPLHGFLKKKRFYMDLPSEAEYLKKDDSFTYKDILGSLILYKHEGDEETTDSFTLNITNGAYFDRVVISVVIGLIHDETPRVDINDVLRVQKGFAERITSSLLKSTDVDTDDSKIIYRFVQSPESGSVRLNKNGVIKELTTQKPHNTFTQTDINKGRLEYSDDGSGKPGIVKFKFTVADPQGNELLNQYFYINILEDRTPPKIDKNQGLILPEGGSTLLTTTFLSASDVNIHDGLLNYTVERQPKFGHLEFVSAPGVPISEFKQSDLTANKVKYVHTRPNEVHSDSFLFSVSDGQNKVNDEFIISIIPVDNSVPVVINKGLRVQEGIRKLITEFDLKAIDKDTKVDQIVFNVVDPTWHGLLQLKQQGSHNYGEAVSSFTMEDIYKNRLSYLHSGSEAQMDFFKFTLSDGTHIQFSTQDETGEILPPSVRPRKFEIQILPLGDGSPILETNLGLQFLENGDYEAFNVIGENELKSTSPNTEDKDLIYVVTTPPKFGQLQNNDNPESPVSSFTQEDINQGKIQYILTGNSSASEDHFVFELRNTGTNVVPFNTFHISWSVVSFEEQTFNISETGRVARIPIVRTGNLKQFSVVTCVPIPGTATSVKSESVQGTYDFVQHSGQIRFDEWQTRKECVITINDDIIFEGEEIFYVELRASDHAVIGERSEVAVSIYDPEDEPAIEFTQETFHVNETDGYLIASLKRTGDTSQAVSVICSTASMTAIGSTGVQLQPGADFIGREETNANRVVIPQDERETTCAVKIIDDNINEPAEHFELILSSPSSGARLGSVSKAIATIDGPNDESMIFFSDRLYVFNESAGTVEIDVKRSSSDQTHTSIVWCATRLSSPLSALPGKDYVPVANRITFRPGQTTQKCQLTIIDDDVHPKLEGNETFEVFLSSPVGSNLHKPFSAVVLITDFAEDVAILQFENSQYKVDEKNSSINVPIVRSGDSGYDSTVICYTRQGTAETGIDFKKRRYHQSSSITFKPGEMTKNCTVSIRDDTKFEKNESFSLFLSSAFGDKSYPVVRIGERNNATIVITNSDDVPRVQFKEAAYSIAEPKSASQINTVIVQVVRTGDINQKSSVRCSTRDSSAVSDVDYKAKSEILHFKPGVKSLYFAVDVLYNSEMEWHESFTILLEPEEVVGAELGEIHSTTVTILDNKVTGDIVFPAIPLVVSLPYYDDVEKGLDIDPSPGYPLVCVTPCDSHYPAYQSTRNLCEKEGINSSRVSFKWEIAYPNRIGENSYQPFMEITDNTLFTRVDGLVLDNVYFRPRFRLRCSATPIDHKGKAGIRLNSNTVEISPLKSVCHSSIYPGDPFSYQAQSFIASLMYTPISDPEHPNTIQISVNIPHQDGMLPLVSTMPLNNIKFLLSDPMYRQQHVCSNLMAPPSDNSKNDTGFFAFNPKRVNSETAFAYQYDVGLRTPQTLQLYRHLNLDSCTWTFRAWYHMTDLVDQCGGKILTNLEVTDTGQSFLTVRVPLYVSYLYASAAVGWSSLEHHTEMQFSFYYQTVLWKTGLEEDGQFGGQLQVLKIAIGEDGHLVIDFRTQTDFRGLYVLEHPSQPSMKSRLIPPDEMPISFDLVLLWSDKTYDKPRQLWRATSQDNRKDYTGQYVVELLPCTVESTQKYDATENPMKCSAHKPQRFQLPISFKQTNRPVPAKYSLNTRFQLTNDEKLFSSDPKSLENSGSSIEELDYNGAFAEGQKIYGRVLWNPDQDLSTAYELSIKKVYICTGKDGYIPTYDPTGETYKEGSQFGCVRPNSNLEHRYLVLDRDHTEKLKTDALNSKFGAKFFQENFEYSHLKQLPGVDGFEMPVDPLYEINSGHQWYLQVVYVIGPANSPSRVQRSAMITYGNSLLQDNKNGTNMRMFLLDKEVLASRAGDIISTIVPGVALFVLLMAIISFIFIRRHLKRKQVSLDSSMVSSSVGLTRVTRMGDVNKGTQV